MSSDGSPFVNLSEDLVTVRIEGILALSGSQSIYGQLDTLLAERGYCLALFDLSKADLPTPESRKWISHWFRQRDVERIALATFGTGLLVRTVNRMFDRVVSLLSGRPSPARHFTNQADAQAWLQEMRSALQAK